MSLVLLTVFILTDCEKLCNVALLIRRNFIYNKRFIIKAILSQHKGELQYVTKISYIYENLQSYHMGDWFY